MFELQAYKDGNALRNKHLLNGYIENESGLDVLGDQSISTFYKMLKKGSEK